MSEHLPVDELTRIVNARTPAELAEDESFWARLTQKYAIDDRFVQLNYGYYHPSFQPVLEVELEMARELNRRGSHFKLSESGPLLEKARADLARVADADAGEIAVTRNATEALNIVIHGFPLAAGDEVVASDQDYGSMTQAWDQRARVGGVVVRRAKVPLDPANDEDVVAAFEREITPRTRLLQVTHMIHATGQLLPVDKLCALGRRRGIPVLVDAAHSFAHVDLSIRELGCEFLGTSLHKWLGAPLGTGMLFVRKDWIPRLEPLFGDTQAAADDIRRLEHFGNRPDSAVAGIRAAVRWHEALTTPVKRARLSKLQRRWTEPMRAWERFRLLTPGDPARHGAIGAFEMRGVDAAKLFDYLLQKHGLFTSIQQIGETRALRITPGLPTPAAHIDRLVAALEGAKREF